MPSKSATALRQQKATDKAKAPATTTTHGKSAGAYALNTTNAESSSPSWETTYVISSTDDIFFAFDVPSNLSGHDALELDVFMPGGLPYEGYSVSFAAGVTAAAGEQQAEATSTGYRVWADMPVSGTWIQQYDLSGSWTATGDVNGLSETAELTLR